MLRPNSKIHNVGKREVAGILNYPVVVQEKIDGSQFSFTVAGTPGNDDFELHCKSRSQPINIAEPPKLFAPAVTWCIENVHDLTPGLIYRAEAMCAPRHNKLAYGRAPKAGFVLFDVERGENDYFGPQELAEEADRLGCEVVPYQVFDQGTFTQADAEKWLNTDSMLGDVKIEGFVIKAYGVVDQWGQTLMAKHVSDAFKEIMGTKKNTKQSPVEWMIERYRGHARWNKVVQHLSESEQLDHSMKDVGPLLKELATDLLNEEQDAIKQLLFDHYWKDIQRGVSFGFAEWYKGQLLERQFEATERADTED